MATAAPRSRPALALVRRRASRFDRTSNRRGRRTDGGLPREFRFLVRRRFDSRTRRSVGFRDSLLQSFERHGCPLFDPRRSSRHTRGARRTRDSHGSRGRRRERLLRLWRVECPVTATRATSPATSARGATAGTCTACSDFSRARATCWRSPRGTTASEPRRRRGDGRHVPISNAPPIPRTLPSPLDSSLLDRPFVVAPDVISRLRSRFPPAFAPAEGQLRG